ncbi:CYFA0S05e03268g1_1 [Cyberlindnera fabianii]|uniref:Maintenance of mitochondrial morphology protein 1 n=1 Tax=Cyberlindnera fabianii TaxID=36022 RepID=A0A061ASY2_CYBFA|nr:Maintenance of mitochondrial morphology protein 1 [Cyberlindnera fabianii]CDR40686.1 CYFA0S05e03268g1_1 [Cyberlindnera fabianii]
MTDALLAESETATVVIQEGAASTLITLDEYINRALPYHLQKQLANASHTSTRWSFTQGLLIGQFSVIVVIIFFIKFFVFSETSSTNDALKDLKKAPVIAKKEVSSSSTDQEAQLKSINSILEKTYYNVETHSPESLDWFNVLIAQTINQFRQEALLSDNIVHSLNDFLEKTDLPDFLDKIRITELDIGDDYPIFSNCRIKKNPLNLSNLQAMIDVDLADTLTLGIETSLLLNKPKPLTAILPIQLSVSIVRFSGCLTVSLITVDDGDGVEAQGEDKPGKGTALMFSFAPDFRLEFSIKSLIGSRSKLENVPKIGNLVESQLKRWFIERCVEPRSQVIRLPNMWPRRKNVREPQVVGTATSLD